MVDRAEFGAWIESYERAWRAEGTARLRDLFTADATYLHSPYEKPVAGLAEIARDWEAERDGANEVFTMTADIVAVDGDTGVARVEVRYAGQEYRDLWVVRFAADGRCSAFEEWPFWPDQPWNPGSSSGA
jgi:ketosteroid isomerase-like protein